MFNLRFLFLLLLSAFAWSQLTLAEAARLTIDRIFDSPELDGAVPSGLKFSPQGQRLTFLQPKKDNYEVLDLWEYDLKTGQPHLLVDSRSLQTGTLSEEEKARRERMRISRQGIVEYFWSENGDKIIFPAAGDLYLQDSNKKLRRLTQNAGAELDVRFSPKDTYVSFVRDQNLYVFDLKSGKEFAVTTRGKDHLSFGVAEFVAQEEMGRYTGYWWSEDETYLALMEVDESPVKWVDRYEINADSVVTRKQRYPEAGTSNARVRLAIVRLEDVRGGRPQVEFIPIAAKEEVYLPRAEWTPDHKLAYQVQTRDQKRLEMFIYDPLTRRSIKVLREHDGRWVNLHNDWKWLEKSSNFVWGSERSGYHHLYLMDRKGKTLRPLTQGIWAVDRLEGVDEENGWVYFTANKVSPTQRHLFRVSLKHPSEPEVLTPEEGWHGVVMDKPARRFVHYYSSPQTPPRVTLHAANGEKIASLAENKVDAHHPLYPYRNALQTPEFGAFKGPSGDLIHYLLYKPRSFDPKKKYPLIVEGYGGPHVQMVRKAWGGKWGLIAQILLDRGFVVAVFDNRGSSRRGKAFESALYKAFGTVEVKDQKAGVEHLVKLGIVDPARVGFFGWSYGGYLALNLATKAPETFKANVAVAPVTDFALYDTHYTERYMGLPKTNVGAYRRANVLNYIPQLRGNLMIVHGMADDNVLFTNSTMLFKKLQEEGKIYESLTYPGSKHGIYGRRNQIHLYKSIVDFFERHLRPGL
ncbi:MAG: DPP IV N-terminal domain-containing protein [Bdellovibrionales bacterium]